MKYKALIFDLDGTLLYTLEDLMNSTNYALSKFSYPQRTIKEIQYFIGNGVAVLMKRSAPKNCSEERLNELLAVFKEHYMKHMYDTTKAYVGVVEMLEKLKEMGYKTAIVSNKLDVAVKELDKLYFNGLFDDAIGAPPHAKKPDPYSVYECMKNLKVRPEECIYIGDTDVDLETAHNAGLKCIGVSWGFRGHEFLQNINCDYIIDNPADIFNLV